MEYMVQDTETKENFILSEYARAGIQKQIHKGYLAGIVDGVAYTVSVSISPTSLSGGNQQLTDKAKKFVHRYTADHILNSGVTFSTVSTQTISLWRGDYGLSIADLKSFKAPLFRNGSSYIVIDMYVRITFRVVTNQIKLKKELSEVQYEKAYQIGYEYLTHVAEQNHWEHKEIFEESENQGHGYKYGLTLVGYEDENHEIESGVVSIDLANLDEWVDKCTQCGSYITGDTCQNEDEEIICEDCLINNIAKRKGLINE